MTVRRRLDRLEAVAPRLRELRRTAEAFEAEQRELMAEGRRRHGFDVPALVRWVRAGLKAGRVRAEASALMGHDRPDTMTESEAWSCLERQFPEIPPDLLRQAFDRLIALAEAPEP